MNTKSPCWHFKFILFVTGRGEKEHLQRLFDTISDIGICSFHAKERIGQLRPVSSAKRQVEMVRSGNKVPSKDWEKIVVPAIRYINADDCHYVLLIDDLEHSGIDDVDAIFNRYRNALDIGLGTKKNRAAVHFLVNMLEAYFFAHAEATNRTLSLSNPLPPSTGDVEQIRNPKSNLKQIYPSYNEIEDAGTILNAIDLNVVLADQDNCAWLRSCIKWIVDILEAYPDPQSIDLSGIRASMHLDDGRVSSVTANQ